MSRLASEVVVAIVSQSHRLIWKLFVDESEPLGEKSDASSGTEVVLGEIPAVVRLALGSERLRLFVSSKRIIFAHIGKSGAGAVATRSFFGWLSEAVESLFRSPRESSRKRKLRSLTLGEILAADRDNFSVDHDEVVGVEIVELPQVTVVTMLTTRDKWEFRSVMAADAVAGLLGKVLAGKVSVRWSGRSGSLPSPVDSR